MPLEIDACISFQCNKCLRQWKLRNGFNFDFTQSIIWNFVLCKNDFIQTNENLLKKGLRCVFHFSLSLPLSTFFSIYIWIQKCVLKCQHRWLFERNVCMRHHRCRRHHALNGLRQHNASIWSNDFRIQQVHGVFVCCASVQSACIEMDWLQSFHGNLICCFN